MSRAAACLVSGAAIVGGSAAAWAAQSDVEDMDQANEPEAMEFERVRKSLQLTSEQEEAARSLFSECARRMQSAHTKWNEYNESLRTRHIDSREMWKLQMDSYRKLNEYGERIRAERNRDIQLLLTESQAPKWELFERDVRRIESLQNNGQFTGGRFDVVRETERALGKAEMSEEIVVTLEEYQVAADRPARVLLENRRAVMERYFDAASMEDFDEQELATDPLVAAGYQAARELQEINVRFARRIMGSLTAEQATSFEKALLATRAWSDDEHYAYVRTCAGMLGSVRTLESLTEAQEASLKDIESRFREQELLQSRREFDASVESEKAQTLDQLIVRREAPEEHAAVKSAADARQALSDQILREIRGVLSAEQLAELGPPFAEAPERLELNFDED
jgi:hypothetical protein